MYNVLSPVIRFLKIKINELNREIDDKEKEYRQKFTEEKFKKVRKIDRNWLNMEINFILENFNVFCEREPNLDILKSYWISVNHKITGKDTLNNLASLFFKEPTDEALYNVTKEINEKKEKILSEINKIEDKLKFFDVEKDPEKKALVARCERDLLINLLNNNQDYYKRMNLSKKMILCPFCFELLFNTDKNIRRDWQHH